MKILMINKYYFIKGGSERYFFELTKILENNGHQVIPFAMQHPNNFKSEYSEFFVDNIEFNLNSRYEKIKNGVKIANRIIYSVEAKNKVDQLINRVKPDLAHLHMIDHQISPSILHAIKKYDIPVLQTVHQSKLICPNYRMYNWHKKQICEKCLGGHFYHPVIEKCHKDSRIAGLLIAVEAYIHKWIKIYEKNIDIYHVPSRFMGRKFIQAGIDEKKVKHLYYTININDYPPYYEFEDYFVYYGRLEGAKGLMTLLKAMRQIKRSKLLMIGTGPEQVKLEEFAINNNLKNVEFVGYKSGDILQKLVSNAKFVIIPSECYDNSPLVIYESFSMGKPVIGSNMGGIPELIDHEENGLHFEVGDDNKLAQSINFLLDHPELIRQYGKNARKKAEREFSSENHYQKLISLYRQISE